MKLILTRPLLLLLLSSAAFCQPFSFGAKFGVPLTDFFHTVDSSNYSFSATTNRYIVGPTAELHLPFGFGIEVDALYRHMSYNGSGLVSSITNSSVNSGDWEFPLMVKYRFPGVLARPFIDAGPTWNKLSGLSQSVRQSVSNQNLTVVNKDTTTGFVVGGGLDIHIKLHIMPEIRYTHWGSAQITDPTGLLRSSKNQAEFLLGITF